MAHFQTQRLQTRRVQVIGCMAWASAGRGGARDQARGCTPPPCHPRILQGCQRSLRREPDNRDDRCVDLFALRRWLCARVMYTAPSRSHLRAEVVYVTPARSPLRRLQATEVSSKSEPTSGVRGELGILRINFIFRPGSSSYVIDGFPDSLLFHTGGCEQL